MKHIPDKEKHLFYSEDQTKQKYAIWFSQWYFYIPKEKIYNF